MKNIFKFMGIALMATSLLVACNDNNEGEEPDDTTSTPVNPPAPQASYSLTWNGVDQKDNAPVVNAKVVTDAPISIQGGEILEFSAENATSDFPAFYVTFGTSGDQIMFAGTAQFQDGSTLNDYCPTEVYWQAAVDLDANTQIGDYQYYTMNASPVYGAFDATALTVNCDLNMKFFSALDYISSVRSWEYTGDTTGMAIGDSLIDTAKYMAYYQAYMTALQDFMETADKKDMLFNLTNYTFTR